MTLTELYFSIDKHLQEDSRPSVYLNSVYSDPLFQEYPFHMLYRLKQTEQSPLHHPEGNVWNHTMLVVDEAATVKKKSNNRRVFLWAALLHDIGKPDTTRRRKGKITAYDHDKVGAELARQFLQEFITDSRFVQAVSQLIRYHMQILFVAKGLPFADIEGMARSTSLQEVALLGLCDRLGRGHSDRAKEEETIRIFLEKCDSVLSKS